MNNQENKTPSTEPSETQKKSNDCDSRNKKKIIAAIANHCGTDRRYFCLLHYEKPF